MIAERMELGISTNLEYTYVVAGDVLMRYHQINPPRENKRSPHIFHQL